MHIALAGALSSLGAVLCTEGSPAAFLVRHIPRLLVRSLVQVSEGGNQLASLSHQLVYLPLSSSPFVSL